MLSEVACIAVRGFACIALKSNRGTVLESYRTVFMAGGSCGGRRDCLSLCGLGADWLRRFDIYISICTFKLFFTKAVDYKYSNFDVIQRVLLLAIYSRP